MERVDLDHNSGGRIRPEVASALSDLLRLDLGNPSSLHAAGRRARDLVEAARDDVAALVGARPAEIVFTSGGTEANNLAVLGSVGRGHQVVAPAIEHASLLRAVERAARRGARSTLLRPDACGRVSAAQVGDALESGAALVCVGWANGEIGTVQPVREIAAEVRARFPEARIHSDAVQAAGLCDLDFRASGLDLLAVSGHKIGALTGVGALVVGPRAALESQIVGGPQERERRAGTENVLGIASFGLAARFARIGREARAERARLLRARLWRGLEAAAMPVVRLGPDDGLPNTLSVAFPGLRGDALVLALDLEGLAVATGSACAAGAAEPSHVLRAIGCTEEVARSTLRLSFGPDLDEADVDAAVRRIGDVVRRARSTAGRGRSNRAA